MKAGEPWLALKHPERGQEDLLLLGHRDATLAIKSQFTGHGRSVQQR